MAQLKINGKILVKMKTSLLWVLKDLKLTGNKIWMWWRLLCVCAHKCEKAVELELET